MAGFFLLDGTSGLFNVQTDVFSTDLTNANTASGTLPAATSTNFDSWQCAANYMSLDITAEFIIRTTFCSNRWVGRVPGLRDLNGILDGFESKGSKISDPLYLFSTTKGIPMICTLDTGCSLSLMAMASRRHLGVRAWSNTEMGVSFSQDGTFIQPSTSWVTS